MAAVFEERACAEFLLQIILKRDDLTVKEAVSYTHLMVDKGLEQVEQKNKVSQNLHNSTVLSE